MENDKKLGKITSMTSSMTPYFQRSEMRGQNIETDKWQSPSARGLIHKHETDENTKKKNCVPIERNVNLNPRQIYKDYN